MMAGVQATLRGLTGASGATPLDGVHALNRRVWEISPDNVFATMFYAELDAGDGTLRYINAGHPPAFLIRAQSMVVERLDIGGTVLGLSRHTVYRQRTVSVRPGDILMASTDGLSEAVDPEGRALDEDGLLRIVRQSGSTDARETVVSILRTVDDYTGGLGPADDRTALVIRLATKREHGRWDIRSVPRLRSPRERSTRSRSTSSFPADDLAASSRRDDSRYTLANWRTSQGAAKLFATNQ